MVEVELVSPAIWGTICVVNVGVESNLETEE
jgi:hypothetical protein